MFSVETQKVSNIMSKHDDRNMNVCQIVTFTTSIVRQIKTITTNVISIVRQKETIATQVRGFNSKTKKCFKVILFHNAFLTDAPKTRIIFCSDYALGRPSACFFDVVIVTNVRQNVRQMKTITTPFLKFLLFLKFRGSSLYFCASKFNFAYS